MDHYRRSALNFLAAHRLDRATTRRVDARWLSERLQHPNARIVPVWRLRNLVSGGDRLSPVYLSARDLGLRDPSRVVLLGTNGRATFFAFEIRDERLDAVVPWPFPSSLMLGFVARASTERIVRADEELEDARWFSRADIVAGVESGALRLPRRVSIAYRLVEDWFDAGDAGPLRAVVGVRPPPGR